MKIDRRNETYKEVTYVRCIYNHSKPWELNYCICVDDVPGSHMEHAGREFGRPKNLPPPSSILSNCFKINTVEKNTAIRDSITESRH